MVALIAEWRDRCYVLHQILGRWFALLNPYTICHLPSKPYWPSIQLRAIAYPLQGTVAEHALDGVSSSFSTSSDPRVVTADMLSSKVHVALRLSHGFIVAREVSR